MMDGCCARKNCYELYGADFMLTSDLRWHVTPDNRHVTLDNRHVTPDTWHVTRPWLLEINSSPALGATTSITSRLCSAVLEDVIKVRTGAVNEPSRSFHICCLQVTVDRAKNRTADTGGWELVYRWVYRCTGVQVLVYRCWCTGAGVQVPGY